jgi:hypothetical protein
MKAKIDNMFPNKKKKNENDPYEINQDEKNEILNLPDFSRNRYFQEVILYYYLQI